MTTEQQAQAAIESTFDTISHWFDRLRSPYVPQHGSILEDDDRDWPYTPVSQIAWVGLAGAADHLDAIRHQVTTRRLFTMAPLTLCRSALVGACQAVWVLSPDNQEVRIRRARTVAAYVYQERLKYLRELRKLYAHSDAGIEFQVDVDEARLGQLQAKRDSDGQHKGIKLITTDMIVEAAGAAFERDSLAINLSLAWRSGSGAAHGQVWPHFNTPAMALSGQGDSGALRGFAVKAELATFSNHYCAAFETAERGWELLDKRGVTWAVEAGGAID